MRILSIGNVGPNAAAHSTENCYRVAFEALGHEVDCMLERDFMRALATREGRTALHARALNANLVIDVLTQGNYPDAREAENLWRVCADAGIPTVAIHLDLFYGLGSPKDSGVQRYALPASHPMFKVAYVFTADGGHDDEWKRDGVNHHWLPPGVRHTEAVDVDGYGVHPSALDTASPPVGVDVVGLRDGRYLVGFAGSDGYHPEWPHRPQLVEWLRDTYKDRFLHIGGSSTPRITGLALNRVLASVPVWVGDSCLTRPDFAYWSDRVPETWGRGGFLIHPHVEALDEHYGMDHPGQGWYVGDWTTLHDVIDYWLADERRRAVTRAYFAAFTRQHDTYLNRAQTILATVGVS